MKLVPPLCYTDGGEQEQSVVLDVKERRLQPTSSESDSIVRAFLCPTQRTSPGSLTPRVSGVSNARAAPKEVEIRLHMGGLNASRGEASHAQSNLSRTN